MREKVLRAFVLSCRRSLCWRMSHLDILFADVCGGNGTGYWSFGECFILLLSSKAVVADVGVWVSALEEISHCLCVQGPCSSQEDKISDQDRDQHICPRLQHWVLAHVCGSYEGCGGIEKSSGCVVVLLCVIVGEQRQLIVPKPWDPSRVLLYIVTDLVVQNCNDSGVESMFVFEGNCHRPRSK